MTGRYLNWMKSYGKRYGYDHSVRRCEPFASCHPEQSEGSRNAQDRLREESCTTQGKLREAISLEGGKNMTVVTRDITFQTKGNCDIIDITSQVANAVAESKVDNGIITLFISGSTAGVTTIEYEHRLLSDFKSMWDKVIPQNIPYEHDKTWGDGNGHSHMRASLLGASLTIPFVNKKLTLGTWQQIVVVDFDNRPRRREIVLQLLGD